MARCWLRGGANTSGNQNSAELYDPATGTWTATGNLGNARYNHTATLLANGEVLVAGGGGNSGDLSSAELYNPASGTWTATGSLNNPRLAHTATLLPNGEVLVAAGLDNSDYLMSAELYDPVAGTWTATASLNTARYGHTATLLANGEVLVAGGSNGTSGFLTSTELFDPATGAWTTTGSLNTPHYVHTATLLPNGEVLVAGGIGTSGSYLTSAELFDAGLGYGSATQPQLNAVTTASSTSALSLTGTNFTGVSEGSGGETNNSSSNIPVVELQSLVNEQTINVPLDPSHGFSSTAFTSLPPSGLVPGYALLTMFVNGTPSVSQIVLYSQAAQTISNFPATETVSLSASPDTLAATTSGGLTITYTVVSGPGTVSGDTLTLTGTGTVVVMAAQAGNGTYAPLSETETITVTTAGNPTDTPTMPPWGLVVLAGVLMMAAGKSLRGRDASGLL